MSGQQPILKKTKQPPNQDIKCLINIFASHECFMYYPKNVNRTLHTMNNLSPDTLNVRRIQAVKLKLNGESLNTIQASTKLSHPTIISAYKAFLQGGWPAVKVKSRGRPKKDDISRQLVDSCLTHMLKNKPGTASFWSTDTVKQWFNQHLNQNLSTKTISRYLKEWGLVPRTVTAPP